MNLRSLSRSGLYRQTRRKRNLHQRDSIGCQL
jgi:hypothetical protein